MGATARAARPDASSSSAAASGEVVLQGRHGRIRRRAAPSATAPFPAAAVAADCAAADAKSCPSDCPQETDAVGIVTAATSGAGAAAIQVQVYDGTGGAKERRWAEAPGHTFAAVHPQHRLTHQHLALGQSPAPLQTAATTTAAPAAAAGPVCRSGQLSQVESVAVQGQPWRHREEGSPTPRGARANVDPSWSAAAGALEPQSGRGSLLRRGRDGRAWDQAASSHALQRPRTRPRARPRAATEERTASAGNHHRIQQRLSRAGARIPALRVSAEDCGRERRRGLVLIERETLIRKEHLEML